MPSHGGEGEGGASVQPTVVTVMTWEGRPAIAFDVISNDADAGLIDHQVTASDGTAELVIPAGGTVSVLFSKRGASGGAYLERSIETIAFDGEAPGEVRVDVDLWTPSSGATETMGLSISYPPKPGASAYRVKTQCLNVGTSSTTYTSSNVPGCTSDGLYDVLVLALGASGEFLDYATLSDQSFVADGDKSHVLSWANESVSVIPFEVTSIPAAALSLEISSTAVAYHGGWAILASQSREVSNPGSQYSGALGHLLGFGDRHCDHAIVTLGMAASAPSSALYRFRCGPTENVSAFEWDASRLARFEVAAPTLSPLTLHWVETWPGEPGDVLSVGQSWRGGDERTTWVIHQRPMSGEARLPTLPSSLAEFSYSSADTLDTMDSYHSDFAGANGFDDMVAMGIVGLGERLEYHSSFAEL